MRFIFLVPDRVKINHCITWSEKNYLYHVITWPPFLVVFCIKWVMWLFGTWRHMTYGIQPIIIDHCTKNKSNQSRKECGKYSRASFITNSRWLKRQKKYRGTRRRHGFLGCLFLKELFISFRARKYTAKIFKK